MLDSTTKKNIDDCRDVLVGKVPDPKSQIEQITLALIYKFMYDMDTEAVEKFKGKAKFFAPPKYTGNKKEDEKLIDYSKYTWDKLFNPALSGAQMLALYSDALDKLQVNPNMPELFRNIFKNAYLPYRDPATLKLFLKYINLFNYSHSEKLGDAFEYLLSVMGSQGDAGQFRTPRHIIDFVTACVNPQKNETILDPACGTAGFLLSAYKHILLQNTKENVNKENIYNYNNSKNTTTFNKLGGALTPDQRKKLATQFMGYDISPDMVRLSLANMYLHGFTTPQINEYDTLSDEDRWQETFDVILANPPFMTPKGGIRPHKKFGVQANKAEVLFTDYIAEHLNNNGRAGIVVPNGIVATSQTAYKQLRKMLVSDSLLAVISLPAGVFQPYSGVKTSVLILDKRLAKKSKHILFLKIDNDGFDLGAQRREHDKNDLPLALQTLEAYRECLINEKAFEELPVLATLVDKEIVLGNKDVILSAERYFETKSTQTVFDMVKLGDVVIINGNATDPVKAFDQDPFVYIDIEAVENGTGKVSLNKIIKPSDAPSRARRVIKNGDVLVSTVRPNLKAFAYLENLPKNCLASTGFAVLSENEKVLGRYLYDIIRQDLVVEQMVTMSDKGQYPSITASDLAEIKIPLPPIEIQHQIVNEIEAYQKIIDGAKQVVNIYKPSISINADWEMVELGELSTFVQGINTAIDKLNYVATGVKVLQANNIYLGQINFDSLKHITKEEFSTINAKYKPTREDVLYSNIGARFGYASTIDFDEEFTYSWNVLRLIIKDSNKIDKHYLKVILNQDSIREEVVRKNASSTMPFISGKELKLIKIPIPPIEEQQTIVKAIEEEMQLVASNKKLIELFEQKIKNKISQMWGVKKEGVVYAENNEVTLAAEG